MSITDEAMQLMVKHAKDMLEKQFYAAVLGTRSPFVGELRKPDGDLTSFRIRYYEPIKMSYPYGFLLCGVTGGEETIEEMMERWGQQDRRHRFPTTEFDIQSPGFFADLKS